MAVMAVRIVSMKPKGRYVDGSPYYEFTCGFPSSGVMVLPTAFATPEGAQLDAEVDMRAYQARTFPGGMGSVIGATERDGKFHGVVCRYYSRS